MDEQPQLKVEPSGLMVSNGGPLIHLAQANALIRLREITGRVVLTDMVAAEAGALADKPSPQAIQNSIEADV